MSFFFWRGCRPNFFLLRLDRESHAFTVSIGTGEILVLGFCPPRPNASAPMFYYLLHGLLMNSQGARKSVEFMPCAAVTPSDEEDSFHGRTSEDNNIIIKYILDYYYIRTKYWL